MNDVSIRNAENVLNAHFEALFTVIDLERLLQVDKRTVYRLCKQGVLPQPLKVGGSNRWRPNEIAESLKLKTCENVVAGEQNEM
jgi:predicted DNA-binding transcriptional regulator AlpA